MGSVNVDLLFPQNATCNVWIARWRCLDRPRGSLETNVKSDLYYNTSLDQALWNSEKLSIDNDRRSPYSSFSVTFLEQRQRGDALKQSSSQEKVEVLQSYSVLAVAA
jgi:hypothetical protein